MSETVPCLLFEDEHLLVVNKPAGINTHAPSPFSGEGIYDWLRHREPRWGKLAIIHRLDKETSGVLVFSKSALASRSLTEQFTARKIRKRYVLLSDRRPDKARFTATSTLVRVGARYVSRPSAAAGERAETRFTLSGETAGRVRLDAEPITGRTHQIRAHASEHGFPILGDTLYGGADAGRLMLHAEEIAFRHPATEEELTFRALADFEADPRFALRAALIDFNATLACRLIHGASDGWPGWYVDRAGDYLISQSERPLSEVQQKAIEIWMARLELAGVYHKALESKLGQKPVEELSPKRILGRPAPSSFIVRENGIAYELSFAEGYSVGLFFDQRDNRRRFLVNHVASGFPLFDDGPAGKEVLNAFAYTCGFSVCAALSGARVTSLDLSKKYLEWGRRNFSLNALDPSRHDFLYGDVFDWFKRFAKKGRRFDGIVLDPPTFSRSRISGAFQAEKDFATLVTAALPLLQSGGVLFASTNAARLAPQAFIEAVSAAAARAGRRIQQSHYAPQPPDFPVSRKEPAYLKTLSVRIG